MAFSRLRKIPFSQVALTLFGIVIVVMSLHFFKTDTTPALPPDPRYLDITLPIQDRITNLLSYMTLEEKIGQMALIDKNSIEKLEDVPRYGLGALLSGFGAKPMDNTVQGWSDMVLSFTEASKQSRLGIPILYGVDAIHGHSNVPGATIFPHFIGLGATRDAVLVEKIAEATRDELLATHINWTYSPTLDLPRDIRWGRTYETFSDDPALVSLLGSAFVRGTEGNDNGRIKVLSTPKHFIGAGSMLWGTASNENFKIDQGLTLPNEEALRNIYLPPFKSAVVAGVKSVMVGLNSWGNTKLAAEKYLITDVLKGDLGFTGFVVSDWYGVYEIPESNYAAAVTAINAGVDMVMLPFDYKEFVRNVSRAVRRGDITEARIDDATRRILGAKFALGLFDPESERVTHEVVGSPRHHELAREAVSKSMVLLQNKSATLPLKSTVRTIRVAGSAAHNIGRQSGAWTVEWQGIDGNWLPGATSILDGIKQVAGKDVVIEYDALGNFKEGVAEIGIAVVGEKPYAEGWGDLEFPILDSEDREAIKKLQETSDKVIVVIVSGRPLFIAEEVGSWDALVAAWLPGSEGGGVADVLFGKKPFTGTLPLPWPHHSEQLPLAGDGTTSNGTKVLFPRGFKVSTSN